MKIKIILTCLSLVLPLNAISAEAPPWFNLAIKSPNPNELAYFADADEECPISTSGVRDIVEGIFTRSRIKPSELFYEKNRIHLSLTLNCLKRAKGNFVFAYNVKFGKYTPKPAILFDKDYGSYGVGGKEFITQSLKTSTENAITDYLKANFDL